MNSNENINCCSNKITTMLIQTVLILTEYTAHITNCTENCTNITNCCFYKISTMLDPVLEYCAGTVIPTSLNLIKNTSVLFMGPIQN